MGKYVVIDLEMCKVAKGQRKEYPMRNEIIQIGAVLMDEQLNVVKRFNCYVKPEYGWIDPFIERLTGIDQSKVQDAPMLFEALQIFFRWLPEEDVTAVSWSLSDKYQFAKELAAKGIVLERMAELLNSWVDCQKTFTEKVKGVKVYSLSEALNATDILGEGRAHDGLADAYNTALLFAKMEREETLVLNPYYEVAFREEKEAVLGFSLGDLLDGLDLQVIA